MERAASEEGIGSPLCDKRWRAWSLLCVAACWSAAGMAQPQVAGAEAAVKQADAAFWNAYNRCDERAMGEHFTKDAEFYHDKTGLNEGRANIAASMMRGPCSDPQKLRLRREEVPGSVRFDSLAGGFALLSGEHRFLETRAGEPERPSSVARFTSIWQRSGAKWRMRRIVSYAHGPDLPELVAVPVSPEALAQLTGDYAGDSGAAAQVRVDGRTLTLQSGAALFHLVPVGPGLFGVADRPVQFRFGSDTLEVMENGTKVASMRRVPSGS